MIVIGDKMTKKFKLTPVEWEIMESIWEIGGAPSIRDVWQHCFPNGEKAYTNRADNHEHFGEKRFSG